MGTSPPRAFTGSTAPAMPCFGAVREYISVVLRHPGSGTLLQQPLETHRDTEKVNRGSSQESGARKNKPKGLN